MPPTGLPTRGSPIRVAAWISLAVTAASCTLIGGLNKNYAECGPGEHPTEAGCKGGAGGAGTSSSSSSSGCPPAKSCDGVCVDTQTDPDNCGACGQWCPSGASCVGGTCAPCPGTEKVCADACVDERTDPDHCGACDKACALNGTCDQGGCGCPAGATPCTCAMGDPTCTDACADLSADPLHCGICGHACKPHEICSASACECPTSLPSCAGACTDTATDPDNCGQCQYACLATEACIDGNCVEPELLVPATLVSGLAVDADALYWTLSEDSHLHGQVMKRAHQMPSVVTLASDEADPYLVAVDGRGSLYWASAGASGTDVKTIPTGGGARSTLASGQQDVSGLVADAKAVYWTTLDDATVWSLSLSPPSSPVPLATQQTTAVGLTLDDRHLFWAAANGGWVAQMPKTGGTVTHVAGYKGDDPIRVAVNDTTVYWLGNNGGVGKVAIGGGTTLFTVPATAYSPGDIRADGTGIYWVDKDHDQVVRASFDLRTIVPVARVPDLWGPLAIDATYIYFASLAGIHRVAKPKS